MDAPTIFTLVLLAVIGVYAVLYFTNKKRVVNQPGVAGGGGGDGKQIVNKE